MVSFSTLILLPTLFLGSALAGMNCKCQDDRGQFNEATRTCCGRQSNPLTYFPGPNNQCANPANGIDSGAFESCCKSLGVGAAYCWV
ncbi:uncharacterized protein H6S33_003741 [Morchella sextelata]|uniref:uncharacterized protein n=1 Tax=Morchella sextelata TaxID=1174677 RepID=UPI001D03D469|nr:uncharacterized protein H6S33_003741 [Morchella sextelata]KAH0606080.1 hypothetical protein H6S33_003741 [Morchella sextelata]